MGGGVFEEEEEDGGDVFMGMMATHRREKGRGTHTHIFNFILL